jgi:hypothetical protein
MKGNGDGQQPRCDTARGRAGRDRRRPRRRPAAGTRRPPPRPRHKPGDPPGPLHTPRPRVDDLGLPSGPPGQRNDQVVARTRSRARARVHHRPRDGEQLLQLADRVLLDQQAHEHRGPPVIELRSSSSSVAGAGRRSLGTSTDGALRPIRFRTRAPDSNGPGGSPGRANRGSGRRVTTQIGQSPIPVQVGLPQVEHRHTVDPAHGDARRHRR